MTAATAPQQFADALKELYEAAGSPAYALLKHQAARQPSPVKLTDSTLSDWLNGTSVPADPEKVAFLVGFLGSRITEPGYRPRDLAWWKSLHTRARLTRRTTRRGRPALARISSPGVVEARLGQLVSKCDPLALEVHRAVQVLDADTSTDSLPEYVPREHDSRLRAIVDQVLDGGGSKLITLVGGSSTGKTRACWELACYLDQRQVGQWRVWHPYDPSPPEAALADLDRVGRYTVVWLNEAQHYLMPTDPALGERLIAGLRTLLLDVERSPVLVLATLWPQFWDTLTVRPAARQPDPYAQAREALAGTAVPVADAFTPAQVAALATAGTDARLRYAAERAEYGRITQYLAGAPELETRYRTASPGARALIQVAMDARRLGLPLPIPHALLEQAAPSYLADHDWDNANEGWLEDAPC